MVGGTDSRLHDDAAVRNLTGLAMSAARSRSRSPMCSCGTVPSPCIPHHGSPFTAQCSMRCLYAVTALAADGSLVASVLEAPSMAHHREHRTTTRLSAVGTADVARGITMAGK